MDGRNFDDLAKKLARATSRRSFFKGLIGGGAAIVGGSLSTLPEVDAQSGCISFHTTGQGCNNPPGNNCCATDLCIGDNIRNPGAGKCGTCPGGSTFCPNPSHPGFCCNDATQVCAGGECCTKVACPAGQVCGTASDGCGGSQSCGTCPGGQTCSNGQCICQPQSDATTCSGKCGTVNNNCGTPVDCGTSNCAPSTSPCLQVACNSNSCGYSAANEGGSCDDGDPCTSGDQCSSGECVGTPVVCNTPPNALCYLPDGSCNANGGCDYTPVQNNTPCGLCQVCNAGTCVYAGSGTDPNNDCGVCQECDGAGACVNVPDGIDLFGDCDGTDICCGGACQAGPNCGCDVDGDCPDDPDHCMAGVCNVEGGVGTCGYESTCTGSDVCCGGSCETGPNCGCDTDADCASQTDDATCQVGICNVANGVGTCGTKPADFGVVCRAAGASSTCNPQEVCNGEDESCPTDSFAPEGTECGLCQICDGAGACVDVDAGSDPNDDCDVCEVCDGAGACRTVADGTDPLGECPSAGDVCCGGVCQAGPNCGCDSDADCDGDPTRCLEGVCTVDDDGVGTCGTRSTCSGTDICCGGACQTGPNCGCDSDSECTSLTDNSTCKVGICLVDENGVDAICSTKAADQGVVCRAAGASSICNPQEVCNGTDQSCPTDVFAPSGTACGTCKVCNGSGSCVDDTTFPCVCVPAAGTCTGTAGTQGTCCAGLICNGSHVCEVPCDPLHPDQNNPNCLCGHDSGVCPAAAPCCKTAGDSLRRCMKTGNGNCACVGNNTCTRFKNQSVCCLATEGVGECTSPKGKCTPFPPA